jgi:flagellar biogenesis protein FliO
MVVAVVIVFALIKWALPKLLSKISGRLTTGLNSQIRLEESASFPGGTLQVVTVRGRVLLLGLGGGNICTLADLGPAIVNDPGPTFSEYLEQVPDDKPVVKAVVNTPTEELEDDDSVEALRRIKDLLNPR